MNWRVPITEKDFISGYFYYKMCDWNICPRYEQKFDINLIQENDTLFLNLDHIETFVDFLNNSTITSKFILVTQNSDRDFNEVMFNSIKKYVNKIYAINCNFDNEMVHKIPIGFNDHSTEVLEKEDFTFNQKDNLVYMNFKPHHHVERTPCFDYFKKFDWVITESNILPINDFYNTLRTFKYCISPRGTGIDTHRLYESLLYGVIPIVTKSCLDELYHKFPILIVDKWEDVTYDFLVDNYEQRISDYFKWLEENPNWYKSDIWIKK